MIDPDNHVVSFFQYFSTDDEWTAAQEAFAALKKPNEASGE